MPYCPVPPNLGNKTLTFNLLKYITKYASCDLAMLVEKGDDRLLLNAKITEEFTGVANIYLFSKNSIFHSSRKRIQAILKGYHPGIGRYSSCELEAWLNKHLQTNSYDLVHFDMFYMIQYVNHFRSTPTLLVSSDAYSMAFMSARIASKNWYSKVYFYIQEVFLRKYEMNEYTKLDTICLVSEIDQKYLTKLVPKLFTKKIGIAIGEEYIRKKPHSLHGDGKSCSNVLCIGSISIPHIAAAMLDFLNDCYPKIIDKLPDTTFTILGRNPDRKLVKRLQEFPFVKYLDYVDDYSSFLQQDWVYVYPQKSGSGLQTKVQQAMAVGLSVVGFEQAFGGLEVENTKQCYVCHSSDEMSDRVIALLSDKHLRETIGNAAAEHIRTTFSIEHVGSEMIAIYKETIDQHSKFSRDCLYYKKIFKK